MSSYEKSDVSLTWSSFIRNTQMVRVQKQTFNSSPQLHRSSVPLQYFLWNFMSSGNYHVKIFLAKFRFNFQVRLHCLVTTLRCNNFITDILLQMKWSNRAFRNLKDFSIKVAIVPKHNGQRRHLSTKVPKEFFNKKYYTWTIWDSVKISFPWLKLSFHRRSDVCTVIIPKSLTGGFAVCNTINTFSSQTLDVFD